MRAAHQGAKRTGAAPVPRRRRAAVPAPRGSRAAPALPARRRPEPCAACALRRERSREAGFTLLELLVAVAVLGIMVLIQVGPFQQTIVSRDRAEATIERVTAARLALLRLSEELAGAVGLDDERSRFVLLDRTFDESASELRFATTGARRVTAGPQDSVEIVRYFLERDPDRPDSMLLLKEQLPSVAAEGVEPTPMVVLDGVRTFRAEVLPDPRAAWSASWEASGAKVPRAVRLELVLKDTDPASSAYRTTVTLPLGATS